MVPYAVRVLATAVVLTWLYNATGCLLIPWLYHASINPAGGYFLAGVDSLKTTSGYGTYALLVAIVAVVVLSGRFVRPTTSITGVRRNRRVLTRRGEVSRSVVNHQSECDHR